MEFEKLSKQNLKRYNNSLKHYQEKFDQTLQFKIQELSEANNKINDLFMQLALANKLVTKKNKTIEEILIISQEKDQKIKEGNMVIDKLIRENKALKKEKEVVQK